MFFIKKNMVKLTIRKSDAAIYSKFGNETLLMEFKEFFLKKSLSIDNINDIKNNIFNAKTQRYIFESITHYFDKYYLRYLISMSNIDKKFLNKILNENFSEFYLGISDNGIISGIPIHINMLQSIKTTLEKNILNYYNEIIGLNEKKGVYKIKIGSKYYYDFKKIINILKKHTKINIIILKKNNSDNCSKLENTINQNIKDELIYLEKYKKFKELKKIKRAYNDKYSLPFYKLIRSNIIYTEFYEYSNINKDKYFDLFNVLQSKIIEHDDVLKYLKDGLYVDNTLFPNNCKLDSYYGNLTKQFLREYKEFKDISLSKNIKINPFHEKNPKLKLKPFLKNISCFNKYFHNNPDIIYIMIKVEFPFIKDENVYLGFKENKKIKIVGRTYEENIRMPYTNIL
jgi:hypothetical protein